jgi:hypothetical protein
VNCGVEPLGAHAFAPPPGLAEAKTLPTAAVTKHRGSVEHNTARSGTPGSIEVTPQAWGPPVGSVEVAIVPSRRETTQSETIGQLIPYAADGAPGRAATVHVDAPPPGLDEV